MDYNNFNHYAKERMASLRGENKVERWSHFASNVRAKNLMVARLQAFFKREKNQSLVKARRSRG